MTTASDKSGSIGNPKTGRIAGGVLLLTAILTIVAMAHHPSEHESGGAQVGITLGGFIHAAMIILLAANLWGLIIFSVRQKSGGWMLAGILAYGISFIGHLIAAMINGFIVPAVAAGVDHAASGDLFVLLWQSNQAAAKLGIYAACIAFVIWSAFLLRRKELADLVVGVYGLLVSVSAAAALFSGAITLNVNGALIAFSLQATWTGLVGLQMLRRSL
jgi:hypothetical protein